MHIFDKRMIRFESTIIPVIIKLTQILPSRRVSVTELLSHEWAMKGYTKQINWESKIDVNENAVLINLSSMLSWLYNRWNCWMWSVSLKWPSTTACQTFICLRV